jgi:hypothetical protein
MNHITALIVTFSAFASGLFGIYKFIRAKYASYDTRPIRYWLDKPTKIKKRYKTFRKHKLNRRNKYTKISKLNKKYISKLHFAN